MDPQSDCLGHSYRGRHQIQTLRPELLEPLTKSVGIPHQMFFCSFLLTYPPDVPGFDFGLRRMSLQKRVQRRPVLYGNA